MRKHLPESLEIAVLASSQHRCCICQQEQVIVHHVDRNPANNLAENLAVLCLHHHGLAHARFELAHNYTPDVIRHYKREWEGRVANGILPPAVLDATAASLSRTYERQQTALRIVIAQELLAAYRLVLGRYLQAGGPAADLTSRSVEGLATIRVSRWGTLTDLGHLQEYVEILAKTYSVIDAHNSELLRLRGAFIVARDWAQMNLSVARAIVVSLNPLLLSVRNEPMDLSDDFRDSTMLSEAQEAEQSPK